jgi:hypothetical protein
LVLYDREEMIGLISHRKDDKKRDCAHRGGVMRERARERERERERGVGYERTEMGVESILREYSLFCPMVANVQREESALGKVKKG